MKRFLFALMMCLGIQGIVTAQSHEVPITMEPRLGSSPNFYQGYRKLKNKDVKKIMQMNALAFKQYKTGRNRYTWGNVVGGVGGLGIGFGVAGAIIAKDNMYWLIAGVGVVAAVSSFPIYKSGDKYMRKAVDFHNEEVPKYSFWDNKELHFTTSCNGIGLALRF